MTRDKPTRSGLPPLAQELSKDEDMNPTTTELKKEFEESLASLRTMRDEIRVKVHLAGMEAKEQWRQLEPHLAEIEQAAVQVTETTRAAMEDAVRRLRTFLDSLN
jgi:hypothetical protein